MNKLIEKIKHWRDTFGIETPRRYTELTPEQKQRSIDLTQSELNELKEATNKNDILDGLGDVIWTAIGQCMDYGVDPAELINRIYESNMSKLCRTESEAAETVAAYWMGTHPDKKGQSILTAYVKEGKRYVVRKKENNKVMKSLNFKEPNFEGL